jgi:RNA polymerase sigma factor (sigma-70 family)
MLSSEHGSESADRSAIWRDVVARIQAGDDAAMERLYSEFGGGVRFILSRKLGFQDVDDRVHDTFVIVVQAIQRGEVRQPERLMSFVRTIVRRQIAAWVDGAVQTKREMVGIDAATFDTRANPEQRAMAAQRLEIMNRVLGELSVRDRQILTRFYVHEQPAERICEQMDLSETQFRLLKSRAKARFTELVRRKLRRA